MTTADSEGELRGLIQAWDQSAWCLAALALGLGSDGDDDRVAAARQVVQAVGLPDVDSIPGFDPSRSEQIANQAKAPLLQIAALLTDTGAAWLTQSDEALIAQGRASAQAAPMFARFMLPELAGLTEMLAAPGARMLDVGTGVGALAVSYCQVFPTLTVEGIDVLPRVLEIARRMVAASDVAERVVLRQVDVASLTDEARYDLAWVPAPFVPPDALTVGVARVARAMKLGSWILLGHGRFADDPLENALNRLKTLAYGGTACDDTEAQTLLMSAGFGNVTTMPTPHGAPAVTVGQLVAPVH